MDDIIHQNIEIKKWVGVDDGPVLADFIQDLDIDFETEVVVKEQYDDCPFNEDPDKYTGDMGNYGCELEYWYHTALLVVWPKALVMSIMCETDVFGALVVLDCNFAVTSPHPDAHGQLQQIVDYCRRNPLQVWEGGAHSKTDSLTPRLLQLCTRLGTVEDVLQIFQLLAKAIGRDGFRIGVRNVEVVKSIVTTVQKFGWGVLASVLHHLAKTLALTQGESFADLANQLMTTGNRNAGQLVAKTVFEVYQAHIAQLESQMPPEPVFTWCQPRARLPQWPHGEGFLRGPTEKLVVTGFTRIAEAREFCKDYCATTNAGYSVIGTTGGQGLKSFCEIKKTCRFFEVDYANWRKKQELKLVRLAFEKFRSAVPKPSVGSVTALPDGSGQRDMERRRSDDVTGKTTKTAETSYFLL